MAIHAKLPLSPEALQRRLAFLQDRANWHMEKGRGKFARVCAATLKRDAAAVALMIGEAGTAMDLLKDAGETFIRSGVLAGFTLLQLAGEDRSEAIQKHRMALNYLQRNLRREPNDAPVRTRGRIHREVVHGPNDFLGVYQFLATAPFKSAFQETLYSDLALKLHKDRAFFVGSSDFPATEYLMALEFLTNSDGGETSQGEVFKAVQSLFLRRRDYLRAAREDAYHWQKMLYPARLLDLNAVGLAVTSLDCRGTDAMVAEAASGIDDPLASLPIDAARRLRKPPG